MSFIPIYIPTVAKNQKKYVNDCLDSNMMSFRGKYVQEVEQRLAEYSGTNYFSLTFNGSVSLITILSALGIGHGDEVITQSLTYVATVYSILNVGATPVIVDSTHDYQMDLTQLDKAITKKTKAILVAQLYGSSPDMFALKQFCEDRNVLLIEDSAEVFGCGYITDDTWCRTDPGFTNIGSFGIASSFSFFQNKVICSAGEGGGIATNSEELYDRINFIKMQSHKGGFVHEGPIGYNHRATNVQAAVLLAQFEQVEDIVDRKRHIASYYRAHLHDKIGKVLPADNLYSTEWMPLFTLPKTYNYIRFHDRLRDFDIDSRPCFTPMHLMEGFKKCKRIGKFPVCSKIYKKGFNLPCYPDLTDEQLEYIVESVNKIITD